MSGEWFTVVTLLIGAFAGFVAQEISATLRARHEDDIWKRNKRAEVVETAVTIGSAMYTKSHADYDRWRLDIAQTNFKLQLYCSAEMLGAFRSVTDGMLLVSELHPDSPDANDPRVKTIQGEGNWYMLAMGRHELGTARKEDDSAKKAKERYLAVFAAMKEADDD